MTSQDTVEMLPVRVWRWLKSHVVQEVPESSELCEFDCRKEQCTEEEWATCERRERKAAGELWPEQKTATHGETAQPATSAPATVKTDGRG